MKRKAAFFDIDGTLFRNSLLIEHFKLLLKYDMLHESAWANNVKDKYKKWEMRKGDFEEYLDELVSTYIEGIQNISLDYIDFVAKRVIETKGDKIYLYTKNALKKHLENKDLVIIISGSPDFLVSKMAKKYNVTDYVGTKYLVEDKKFTGKMIPMWDSKSKQKAIEYFVKKYDIDLENSYAYGDTTGDLSMFRSVGNPVLVNPAKRLLEKAKKDPDVNKNAKVVVERKNVVFTFSLKDKSNVSIDFLDI